MNNQPKTVKTASSHCHAARGLAVAATLMGLGAASAQSVPDAGTLLQQIEQPRRFTLPPATPSAPALPAPMQSLDGATVTVSAFRFAGNTRMSYRQLIPAVASFLNRPIGFSELQTAASAVAAAYRESGWVVRVFLPQQDITSGTVRIQVVEAVFGAVRLEGEPTRVSAARLTAVVESAQPPGALVNGDALDRALLLIDDLPGIRATGRLVEGRQQAETDLVLSAADDRMASVDLLADNAGSRSTGRARVLANLGLNSPLGLGDLAGATLLHTQGSNYGRLAWSLPVGNGGWRLGANASHMAYKVVTPEFALLDARGTSSTAGLDASYPLLRSRLRNLYLAVNLDSKRFDNQSAGVTTTRYKVALASLALNGNLYDNLAGGGANNASLALVHGRVDLTGSPNQGADAATTRTDGSFSKLRYAAARQQSITPSIALYAALSGQIAGKNLDSSEKFYLGGASGVRAYPTSEGSGSEGQLLNIELRTRLPADFELIGFYDWGSVRVNKDNAIAGAAALNRYALHGLGVSLGWTGNAGLSLKATLARRLGSNPNATSTGTDQDGTLDKQRLWLQASLPF
jgi:hemolysin activation/secretion protein